MLRSSRIRHNGDTGADVQQGPAHRFLFRLSPCVNLLYGLLLLNVPWVFHTPVRDTGVLGFLPRQISVRNWNQRVNGIIQPNICYKVRIPSGVFGIASLALYASASNHVFGQMLGLSGSCVLLPYVPLYRLSWHRENYCDCALVHPDKHLSR